jgi:hypothetical protein
MISKKIELSVLDFGETVDPYDQIEDVQNYAALAEQLGFKRFWMGEHYIKNTLFSNPEPLIPAIASRTKKISIGTAGLLIRQHSIQRLACSFALLEKMYPERIDLGLVAPTLRPGTKIDSSINTNSAGQIFQEFIDYYHKDQIASGLHPQLWHLTTSIKSYNVNNHDNAVNVSKSLFHGFSNFNPEIEELQRLKEYFQKKNLSEPRMTIAIGCFVNHSKKKINDLKKFYKPLLSAEAFQMCLLNSPSSFVSRLYEVAYKYQTSDIIILNLGRSYKDKTDCLHIISDLLNLKDAF